jgi:hypothetical protein
MTTRKSTVANAENGESLPERHGIGIDAQGGSVIDPTKNVLDAIRAESKYQDAMRGASELLADAKIEALEKITQLRAEHVREVAAAESLRVDQQSALRTEYERRLAEAEAKRIDAIRAVDVNAVSVSAQRSSDQASVLAAQVQQSAEQLRTQGAQSAEALRSLVASTAAAAATTLQQLVGGLSTRITTLEQAQYEGKGKSAYADPQIAELLSKVDTLNRNASVGAGKTEGINSAWAVAGAVVTLAIGIVGTILLERQSAPAVSPQVIYAPAPAVAQPKPGP